MRACAVRAVRRGLPRGPRRLDDGRRAAVDPGRPRPVHRRRCSGSSAPTCSATAASCCSAAAPPTCSGGAGCSWSGWPCSSPSPASAGSPTDGLDADRRPLRHRGRRRLHDAGRPVDHHHELRGGPAAQPGAAGLRRRRRPAGSRSAWSPAACSTAIGWRWVFFAPVVLAALLLVAGAPRVPRDARRPRSRRFDLAGALTRHRRDDAARLRRRARARRRRPRSRRGGCAARALLLAAFVAVERRAPGAAGAAGHPALGRAGARNLGAMLFVGSFVGVPVHRRAVPAGAARLVGARDRAGAGRAGHRRDPRADAHAGLVRAVRQPAR